MKDLVSIVIPTIGRKVQVDALLRSIGESMYRNYEIVIVDQNHPRILGEIVVKHESRMPILHLEVDFAGAAKARNYGAMHARGEHLFFPDDDSELYADTLQKFMEHAKKTGADVLFGKCQDRTAADSAGTFSREGGYLSLKRHLNMFIESTMFIKKETFLRYLFDPSFGVGTFYGAEEAYDLVLRMLYDGVAIYYTPEARVYHPHKIINHSNQSEIRRVFSYRCGFAHLCVKHKLYRKYVSRLLKVILYMFYTIAVARKKTRYYCAELLGLLAGGVVR
jgi:glycosyltransferase involved in cell wall biosynthesis